jgi:hypothetical protein
MRALLATAESSCRKLRALRSAVSRARPLPSISHSNWLAAMRSPSAPCQVTVADGSQRRTHSSNQAVPHSTPASREITVALTWRSPGTRLAVRSPAPTSSSQGGIHVAGNFGGERVIEGDGHLKVLVTVEGANFTAGRRRQSIRCRAGARPRSLRRRSGRSARSHWQPGGRPLRHADARRPAGPARLASSGRAARR